MALRDNLGLEVTGATEAALADYELALHQLQCFIGDPVATIDRAIAQAPDFMMAHVFKGFLFGLATEPEATAVARVCAQTAEPLVGTAREKAHARALTELAHGGWHQASATLEALTIETPRDALALLAGHQIDFFTGNARLLRDRIARARPAWSDAMPGHHSILAMQAFGFEENAEYERAEALGRRAIELQPRDGWAQHAVAHVMEMQSRQRDGIAWMRDNQAQWTKENFLQVHNWWHLALFHYDLGEADEVLALFDGPIYGKGSTLALNLVDASAILWRLHLGGVNVGDRWQALAESWAPKAKAGNYAFNDMHAMMAFVGADRMALARDLLDAQRQAIEAQDDNAAFTRDVGNPACAAILAFGKGDFAETVRLLWPIRAIAHRFGGSHAQRDVIDLTLIEAALRSGNGAMARGWWRSACRRGRGVRCRRCMSAVRMRWRPESEADLIALKSEHFRRKTEIAVNALSLCFYAIPDAKPLHTFLLELLSVGKWGFHDCAAGKAAAFLDPARQIA